MQYKDYKEYYDSALKTTAKDLSQLFQDTNPKDWDKIWTSILVLEYLYQIQDHYARVREYVRTYLPNATEAQSALDELNTIDANNVEQGIKLIKGSMVNNSKLYNALSSLYEEYNKKVENSERLGLALLFLGFAIVIASAIIFHAAAAIALIVGAALVISGFIAGVFAINYEHKQTDIKNSMLLLDLADQETFSKTLKHSWTDSDNHNSLNTISRVHQKPTTELMQFFSEKKAPFFSEKPLKDMVQDKFKP